MKRFIVVFFLFAFAYGQGVKNPLWSYPKDSLYALAGYLDSSNRASAKSLDSAIKARAAFNAATYQRIDGMGTYLTGITGPQVNAALGYSPLAAVPASYATTAYNDGRYAPITNVPNWNTAYGWGNHALAGYLTSVPAAYETAATAGSKYATQTAVAANTTVIANHTSQLAAQKASADSLLAAFIALKTTATANTSAITSLQTSAVQNWKVLFTSRPADSLVVNTGTQIQVTPGGYGSTGLSAATLDTTKIYRYTQFFYYTSSSAITAPTATIQVHLGGSNLVEIPAGNLAVIALGAMRLGTITVYMKFKNSTLFYVSGGVKYETATQRLFYEYNVLNSPSSNIGSGPNTNFYLTAAVSGGTMVFKDALLEYGTPGNTIQN